MNLLCGALKDFWNSIYNTYIRNLDNTTKVNIGIVCIVISIGLFILCTKGHNKAQMVNSWFLFWLSMIVFIIAILFLSVF